jgi:septum site-determining protein MinD
MGKVIGVISGKGGVGKTTTAVNIGATLSHNFKKNVIVVDTNVSSSNLSLHVGAHFHPLTLNDALRGDVNVEETIVNHPSGLKVLPASLSVDDLFVNCDNLPGIVNDLKKEHDIVVLDTAPSIGEETLNALKVCDAVVVVTTPHLPSVTDALKTIKLSEKLNVPVLGVVLNMYRKNAPLTIADVEYMTNNKVIATVPYDTVVDTSVMKKVPVVHFKPNSKTSHGFKSIAASLIGVDYKPEKSWFDRIIGWFVEE